jgi:hypothetical protein
MATRAPNFTLVSNMENEDELTIDTNVGAGLHPHVRANIEGLDDDETRALVAPAVEAFETAVIELGNIHRLPLAADKNAALTPEAKVLQVSAYAEKKVAHVARMIDAAHEGLKTNIKNAETALNAPLEQSVAQPIAQEIRAFAKAMTAGERRKFMSDSIASNDKAALSEP